MESTFADLRSKYDTPRPSTSNIKIVRPVGVRELTALDLRRRWLVTDEKTIALVT
eukprot:CAMPEP_0194669262 /NCGR_PEP_ID=MMETSP0295-20121207/4475_1 /TAXON_ID=39354 /ORGANISM="Heterosigma akashiwo, Strain CCMP2393" /LENGTH=54 /DNA_ID=CAMNT_0039552207 /DNA_START=1640 /DNA_END=1800 /DNA_ORIENTATION=-